MSSLLTREEYEAIARELQLPSGAVIDGKARPAQSGKTFETVNPATGDVLARIAACGKADVDLAVQKAREAFEAGVWSKLHPSQRKKALIKLTKLIRRNLHELAVLESLESGKPIYDIETDDIGAVMAEMGRRGAAGEMPISDALDAPASQLWIYKVSDKYA